MIVQKRTEYNINEETIRTLIDNVNDYYNYADIKCELNTSMTFEEIIEACEGFEMCDIYDDQEGFFLEELDIRSQYAIAREIKKILTKD